jgi:hypothetical protein
MSVRKDHCVRSCRAEQCSIYMCMYAVEDTATGPRLAHLDGARLLVVAVFWYPAEGYALLVRCALTHCGDPGRRLCRYLGLFSFTCVLVLPLVLFGLCLGLGLSGSLRTAGTMQLSRGSLLLISASHEVGGVRMSGSRGLVFFSRVAVRLDACLRCSAHCVSLCITKRPTLGADVC